jgi:hypothetical protein
MHSAGGSPPGLPPPLPPFSANEIAEATSNPDVSAANTVIFLLMFIK